MQTKDVWVIYNKYTRTIELVFAEYFLAYRAWNILKDTVLHDGLVPNKDKMLVCTLQQAIGEIEKAHKQHIEYLEESCNSRWTTT